MKFSVVFVVKVAFLLLRKFNWPKDVSLECQCNKLKDGIYERLAYMQPGTRWDRSSFYVRAEPVIPRFLTHAGKASQFYGRTHF